MGVSLEGQPRSMFGLFSSVVAMDSTKARPLATQHYPRRQDSAVGGNIRAFRNSYQEHTGAISRRLFSKRIYSWVALRMLLYLSIDGASAQLQQKYCSSQNTGADHYIGSDEWQTLGLCKDSCSLYAFGVVKGFECWCSDYVPNPSRSRSDCVTCPQYDLEKCGNSDTGTYGYIDTGVNPLGTAGASDGLPSSTATSTTVSDPKTSTPSSRETTPSSIKASTTSPVLSPDKMTTVPNESLSATHTTPWVSVVTVGGPPTTITFTPSGWSEPTSVSNSGGGGFFDNAGRVAGVFTVLALLLIALIFALFWYMRSRKQRGAPLAAESPTPESYGGGSSSVGMMIGSTSQEKRRSRSVSTIGLTAPYSDRPHQPPPIVSTNSGSSGGSGVPAITPDRITDQRLDPGQVWMRFENDNASRMSVRSLRDDQDYSRRVLRLANPDED